MTTEAPVQQARTRRVGSAALRLALVATGALAAYAVHRLLAADNLSDAADLALSGGALTGICLAAVLALRLTPAGASCAARVVPPAALASVGVVFVATSYADVTVAAQSFLHAPDGPAAIIALGPGDDEARLAGDIQEGAAARLSALLDAHPTVTRIVLTSEGGLADEGDALRQVIATHKLATIVPEDCESACTLAFVGGRQRLVMRGARLGFHAPFEEGLFGQTFAGDKEAAREAYAAAGVDADFIDEALDTSPDDMWYPEVRRLVAAHVATAVVARERAADPSRGTAVTSATPAPHS